jgi:hypothetical protein
MVQVLCAQHIMMEDIHHPEIHDYLKVDRHDPLITGGLDRAPIYKKQGEIRAVIAQGGEEIITKLANGSTETKNTANPGDAIITNPGGEQYVIGADKFRKRYTQKVGDDGEVVEGVFSARGYCRAIDNPWERPITMLASWGEMQNGQADCKIADTFDPETGVVGGEPYIIGNTEFAQTYKLADEISSVTTTSTSPNNQ